MGFCRLESFLLSWLALGTMLTASALLGPRLPRATTTFIRRAAALVAADLPDETIYIIDGTALLYNAYYSREYRNYYSDAEFAEPMLQEIMLANNMTDSGRLENSVTGRVSCGALTAMCMTFARFVRDVQPRYIAMAYDPGHPSFRVEKYPSYKAGRKPPPPDLLPLFDMAPRIMTLLGCHCFKVDKFEADDVMATLSKWSHGRGLNVVHVSVDKDMLQLVDHGVHVMHMKTLDILGIDEVKKKFGVTPRRLVELQALMGDASDNIQGVPGIGPKTASALLGHFESIARIYEYLDGATQTPPEDALRVVDGLGRHKSVYNNLRKFDHSQIEVIKYILTLRDDVPLSQIKLFQESTNSWQIDQRLAEELTTAFFRFRGERTPGKADLLKQMAPSLEKPLSLMRRSYSKLDREE